MGTEFRLRPRDGGTFPFNFTPAKEVHPLNVAIPIIVTVSGTSISEVNEIQSLNTISVSIISWLSVLYALNGRKVTVWILIRYEKVNI